MSNQKKDNSFYDRADEIIALVNEQADSTTNSKVSASLMFAAARFNAFIAASMSKDFDDFKEHREDAIEYFTDQYEINFIDNIDDYIKNYEKYIVEPRGS